MLDRKRATKSMKRRESLPAMSAEEREEQRRSFAYGNTHLSNPDITREMIDAAAERIDAAKPCPECNGTGWRFVHPKRGYAVRCECQREIGGESG